MTLGSFYTVQIPAQDVQPGYYMYKDTWRKVYKVDRFRDHIVITLEDEAEPEMSMAKSEMVPVIVNIRDYCNVRSHL